MKRFAAPASGIGYALLATVGTILLVREEIDSATDAQILTYYADSGNRAIENLGTTMMFVAVLAFLWFLSSLWSRLRSVDREWRVVADLAFGAGLVAAALFAGAAIMLNATATTSEVSADFIVDPDLARFAVGVGYMFLLGYVLVGCVVIAATSVLALRTDVLPRWMAWFGCAAVVLAIIEAFLLPVIVVPLWVVVVSIVMMRSTPAEATADEVTDTFAQV